MCSRNSGIKCESSSQKRKEEKKKKIKSQNQHLVNWTVIGVNFDPRWPHLRINGNQSFRTRQTLLVNQLKSILKKLNAQLIQSTTAACTCVPTAPAVFLKRSNKVLCVSHRFRQQPTHAKSQFIPSHLMQLKPCIPNHGPIINVTESHRILRIGRIQPNGSQF